MRDFASKNVLILLIIRQKTLELMIFTPWEVFLVPTKRNLLMFKLLFRNDSEYS